MIINGVNVDPNTIIVDMIAIPCKQCGKMVLNFIPEPSYVETYICEECSKPKEPENIPLPEPEKTKPVAKKKTKKKRKKK